jgi:hypothetical protein
MWNNKYIKLFALILALIIFINLALVFFNSVSEGFDASITPSVTPNITFPSVTLQNWSSANQIIDTCFNNLNYLNVENKEDYSKLIKYDSNNYNLQYHDSDSNVLAQDNINVVNMETINARDSCGNMISIPRAKVQGDIHYYSSDKLPFGPSSYIPNYEDSIYLSQTLGESQNNKSTYPTTTMEGGFCNEYKNNLSKLEAKCNTLDKTSCGSTTCCALLGGVKCVAGNNGGPIDKTNYSDIYIRNRDYYYYQGKCYGNCKDSTQ